MSNYIPEAVARELKNAREMAFNNNMQTSQYADTIDYKANENNDGVLDVASLADENSTSITDLADYIASLEERIAALEERGE